MELVKIQFKIFRYKYWIFNLKYAYRSISTAPSPTLEFGSASLPQTTE